MKKIKIQFTDFWPSFNLETNFFLMELNKYFICEISENPDYVIYSVYGNEHLKYNCIKIFFTGEPVTPDFNYCDYAIGYDFISFGDRYLRWPMFRIYMEYFDLYNSKLFLENRRKKKDFFCSFVYSNPYTSTNRDKFFEMLSNYKFVHSAGKHKKNIDFDIIDKNLYQSKFKFSIAFENSFFDGYTSEKIIDSIYSGTIPIYYGNSNIGYDIDLHSIINCHTFDNLDIAINYIKTLDNDENLYQECLSKLKLPEYNQSEFSHFLLNIFNQELNKATRSPRGYYYYKNLKKLRIIAYIESFFITQKILNKFLYNGKSIGN